MVFGNWKPVQINVRTIWNEELVFKTHSQQGQMPIVGAGDDRQPYCIYGLYKKKAVVEIFIECTHACTNGPSLIRFVDAQVIVIRTERMCYL